MINVSIIIPVYKVADFIGSCLKSVYDQTYDNIEVILVDDCSPDNSMEIAQPYIEQLQNRFKVQVIKHTKNRGLSAARNTGISTMHGDWLFLLDSDDEITPNCIEYLVEKVIKYKKVDFVIGGVEVIGDNSVYPIKSEEYLTTKETIINDFIKGYWYVMAWNKLINLDFFRKNELWFEEGLLHEDELFSFYLAEKANNMACVYENTYIYKVRTSHSITSDRNMKNLLHILYIVKRKIAYIRSNNNSDVLNDRFLITTAYSFLGMVAKNKFITYSQKKDLILRLDEIYKSKNIMASKENLITKVKSILLSLNYRFKLPVCILYFNLLNWRR